jgi:hypothetical protein
MKKLFNKITDMLADAALLEMDIDIYADSRKAEAVHESLEENLIEVAFAEAADYDDIHEEILREHLSQRDISHLDDCRYSDKDICFT